MLPRMSALLSQNDEEKFKHLLSRTTDILIIFSVPIILFSIIFASPIISLIAGDGYSGAVVPMKIVMPLIFIIGYEQILVTQSLMPLKKDNAILINSIVGAIVGIVCNLIFIPLFASTGAAIVWIVSELSVLIIAQYFTTKYISNTFPFKKLFIEVTRYLPLTFILLIINSFLYPAFIKLLIGTAALVLYVFLIYYFFHKQKSNIFS